MQKNFFKKYFLILHIARHAHVRIGIHTAVHIANIQLQPKNTVCMNQTSLLKMVWYLQFDRHTPISNEKIQNIFTANQQTNIATLLNICEINCNILQFDVSIKKTIRQLSADKDYNKRSFWSYISQKL